MKNRLVTLVIIGLVAILCSTYCEQPTGKSRAGKSKNVGKLVNTSMIVDYGNGVYYFNLISADFANAISQFIGEHPELELIALTGDVTGGSGYAVGYFVVFRRK
ncbi:hypothetical protein ACFL1Y_01050 [Patescibacteria group bacterium]